jgi:hypothetical protein
MAAPGQYLLASSALPKVVRHMSASLPPSGSAAERPAPAREEPPIDPVPAEVRDAARRAFALRDRESLLMSLAHDSSLDGAVAGKPDGSRTLVFRCPDASVEATVVVRSATDTSDLALEVTCSPAGTEVREMQHDREDSPPPQDRHGGRWSLEPVSPGLVSLLLVAGSLRLRTAWVRV